MGVAFWEGHVVARLGREVIDRVRVGPANALRSLRAGRHATLEAVVSGTAASLRQSPLPNDCASTRLSHLSPRHRRPRGVNDRIKVIKRMAYGFRDPACLFLKIKAAFPGKAR